jgi:YD repeat-containing protein
MLEKNHMSSTPRQLLLKGDGSEKRTGAIGQYSVGEKVLGEGTVGNEGNRNVAFTFDKAGLLWLLYWQQESPSHPPQAFLRSLPSSGTSRVVPLTYRTTTPAGTSAPSKLYFNSAICSTGGCGVSWFAADNTWRIMGPDCYTTKGAFDNQGNFYFSRGVNENGVVFRVELADPNRRGETTVFAGCGSLPLGSFAGNARDANFADVLDLEVSPTNSIYFVSTVANRPRTMARVSLDGTIGDIETWSDEEPRPERIAFGNDESIYMLKKTGNYFDFTIDQRMANGETKQYLKPVSGSTYWGGDYGPAENAYSQRISDFGVDDQGNIYFSQYSEASPDWSLCRIRKIAPSGFVSTVVGKGCGNLASSGLGLDSDLPPSNSVLVSPDGTLATIPYARNQHSPPRWAQIFNLNRSVENEIAVVDDASNEVYVFSTNGRRHTQTRDLITNGVRTSFEYDAQGRLTRMLDAHSNPTTFARNAANTLTITSPMNLKTEVELNTKGYLHKLTTPGGAMHEFGYTDDGLMTYYKDPNAHMSTFEFEARTGRLKKDTNAAAAAEAKDGITLKDTTALRRNSPEEKRRYIYSSSVTSAAGNTTEYRSDPEWKGSSSKLSVHSADGVVNTSEYVHGVRSSVKLARASASDNAQTYGMSIDVDYDPDPRFGEGSPYAAKTIMKTRSGLTRTVDVTKTVEPPIGDHLRRPTS